MAELSYRLQRYQRALRWLTAVAKPEEGRGQALRLRPTPSQRAWAMARAGQAEARRFAPEAAVAWYERLSKLRLAQARSWRAIAALRKATTLYNKSHDLEKALPLFRKVHQKHPRTPEAMDARYFIGRIHQWAGNAKQAVSSFQRARSRYPNHEGLQKAIDKRLEELQ